LKQGPFLISKDLNDNARYYNEAFKHYLANDQQMAEKAIPDLIENELAVFHQLIKNGAASNLFVSDNRSYRSYL